MQRCTATTQTCPSLRRSHAQFCLPKPCKSFHSNPNPDQIAWERSTFRNVFVLGIQLGISCCFGIHLLESIPCSSSLHLLCRQSIQPYAGDVLDGQLESRTPGLAWDPRNPGIGACVFLCAFKKRLLSRNLSSLSSYCNSLPVSSLSL